MPRLLSWSTDQPPPSRGTPHGTAQGCAQGCTCNACTDAGSGRSNSPADDRRQGYDR